MSGRDWDWDTLNTDDWEHDDEPEDYDVRCARCGFVVMAKDAVPEEGDEWECMPCWDRNEARIRASELAGEDSNAQ